MRMATLAYARQYRLYSTHEKNAATETVPSFPPAGYHKSASTSESANAEHILNGKRIQWSLVERQVLKAKEPPQG
jgi:hypothetical protein